ncbi:hypothetical protein D3C86_1902990 [compost metagenome]
MVSPFSCLKANFAESIPDSVAKAIPEEKTGSRNSEAFPVKANPSPNNFFTEQE